MKGKIIELETIVINREIGEITIIRKLKKLTFNLRGSLVRGLNVLKILSLLNLEQKVTMLVGLQGNIS